MRTPIAVLAAVAMLVLVACGGDAEAGPADPSADADAAATDVSPSPTPFQTADPEADICLHLTEMDTRLAALRAVELKLPNRVALDIELDKLMSAYVELERVDLGEREDELERSLTRLGYRLGELELAVEDFRTNRRPRRAAPHVEGDAQKVADELAAFTLLSRC